MNNTIILKILFAIKNIPFFIFVPYNSYIVFIRKSFIIFKIQWNIPINKGLETVKANGEYQKIYDKWMTK